MALQLKNYEPALMEGAAIDINVDLGEIMDVNNNEILEFDAVASAVNNVVIANASTGNNPILYNGGEVDTGLTLSGSDGTNLEEILVLDTNASAVNEVTIDNAATGADPVIAATGDDTNINLQLTPKGSAVVFLGGNAGSAIIVAGAVTLNGQRGSIHTGASFLAGSTAVYLFQLVNSSISKSNKLQLSLSDYTAATGYPFVSYYNAGQGSATIALASGLVATPTSGSVVINFLVL